MYTHVVRNAHIVRYVRINVSLIIFLQVRPEASLLRQHYCTTDPSVLKGNELLLGKFDWSGYAYSVLFMWFDTMRLVAGISRDMVPKLPLASRRWWAYLCLGIEKLAE
jgi:hypothetical protein